MRERERERKREKERTRERERESVREKNTCTHTKKNTCTHTNVLCTFCRSLKKTQETSASQRKIEIYFR